MEMPGIEPGAFHMQSERSTTEPHPRYKLYNLTLSMSNKLFWCLIGIAQMVRKQTQLYSILVH